jgi:hypothetical protein
VQSRFLNRIQQQWLISLLLVAVAVRALIPAGFMPSADRPFTLQICPDGFPAQFFNQGHDPHAGPHAGSGSEHANHVDEHALQTDEAPQHGSHERSAARAEHCVFAAAASVGPPPQLSLLATPLAIEAAPQTDFFHPVIELTRYRVQQPRGPPPLS